MLLRQSIRTFLSGLGLLAAAQTSACDFTVFDDLEDDAPVRVLEAPDGYRTSEYGKVLVTAQLDLDGKQVSRLHVSAGADSPVVSERIWDGAALSSGESIRCKKKAQCDKGTGIGGTLLPVAVWGKGLSFEQKGCLLAPGLPNGYMFCETQAASNQYLDLGVPARDKTTVRFAGAGLPADNALGVALVSAQWVETRTGDSLAAELYRLPDTKTTKAPLLVKVSLIDPGTGSPFAENPAPNDFGYAVSIASNDAGELVIAASQPARNRVIVATLDAGATPENVNQKLHVRACIKSPEPRLSGFGKILTLGDVNDDGQPEVVIGIDPLDGKNKKLQRVYLYAGASMPGKVAADATVCPLWDEEPTNVGCFDGVRGVGCTDTAFGAALAVGDVNGDGFGDLIAGAPRADVQGEEEAGVVWVIPGAESGLVLDDMTNLYATGLGSGDRLGTSVAALRTKDRDEPVAGAPGGDAVYVFMCSKLEGDVSPSNLCLPK